MLSLSAADEAELEKWRSRHGRCRLPDERIRPRASLEDVFKKLPRVMALILRARLNARGWLGPLHLEAGEVTDIEAVAKISRPETMLLLLEVAAAMAQAPVEGEHIGAVLEGDNGALYVGPPYAWEGPGVKFSIHGVQAAMLNAWTHGEKQPRNLMVEVPPCACCRQFLRELWHWTTLRLHLAPLPCRKETIKEIAMSVEGLRSDGVQGRFMREARRVISLNTPPTEELVHAAVEAAAYSYAPYSRNYAGIALKTNHGSVHKGRYAEIAASTPGLLAIESAIIDLIMSGGKLDQIAEITLVETKGSVSQFTATQKLVQAIGNVPFRFLNATTT